MARTPNAAALARVQTRLGTEPIIIIEVEWDGSIHRYSDKDFLGIEGKILSISGLDAVVKIGGGGASGDASIVLDDTDGSIKALLNTNDVHKRPARVYQTYEGLALGDEFLLFGGQVSSPIAWDEGERTVAFSIVTVIEDEELGFAPEEGEFDFVAEDAIGVPWPLCFGDVVRVPAVKITEAARGISLTQYGQITIPELEQLCSLAVTLQQAETAKAIADLMPGFTLENYAIVIDNLTSAIAGLNGYLENLVFDSPTQETDLLRYIEVCKEMERWRVHYEEYELKWREANSILAVTESTPGKPAISGIKFYTTKLNKKSNFELLASRFDFGEDEKAALRVRNNLPAYTVTLAPEVPETVGTVEQAQTNLDEYYTAHWVYSTPEQWAQAAFLQDLLTTETILDAEARADATIAWNSMILANSNLTTLRAEKLALEDDLLQIVLTEIIVDGGEKFPQGVATEIIVNGMHFIGSFAGRTFTINTPNVPADTGVVVGSSPNDDQFELADSSIQLKGKYCKFPWGITYCENQNDGLCTVFPILYQQNGSVTGALGLSHDIYDPRDLVGTISETSVFLSKQWIDNLRTSSLPDYADGLSLIRQRDYAINIGDTVYIAGDYKEIYIANLIPSTAIHEVMAYRTVDGVEKLVPIPTNYYVTSLNEAIAGQNATTIRFRRPLTEYYEEQWGNKIYVSLTSSVGPNTVDEIAHLVDTYTDLIKDTASFASVHAAIDAYPSNFAFLDQRGTLGAIEDMAWQARCAAYVKDQTIYLKYLAAASTPVETIDESIIDRLSLEVTLTPTEDLITQLRCKWDADYSAERRNEITLKNNVPIYGLVEEEIDFFIYNIQSLVIMASTFWLIRKSNTWKIANFKTPLNVLRLETFDTAEIDLGQNWIASSAVRGEVEEVVYDTNSQELDFAIRTEVRSGYLTPYVFVWPSAVDVSIVYPTADDPYAGA